MNILKKGVRKVRSILRGNEKSSEVRVLSTDNRLENFIKILDEGYGNKNSFTQQMSINAIGEPIPWFTYSSIEYLGQLDLRKSSILEWGIGNSTLYFAERCSKIISIENNTDWYNLISKKLPVNAAGYLVNDTEYAKFPEHFNEKFDVIIVDGDKRFECLQTAIKILSADGMIIFDNSDRNPSYCEFLRNEDLIQIDFHGFGPIVNFTTTTSLFFRRTMNFKPLTVQPIIPVGGGY